MKKLNDVKEIKNVNTGQIIKAPNITHQHLDSYTNSINDGTWTVINVKSVRRSDIWFFSTLILGMLFVIFVLIFNVDLSDSYKPLYFMWAILLPYIPIKIFFSNSKLFKWLDEKVI